MNSKLVSISVPLELIDQVKKHPCYREPVSGRKHPPGGSGVGGFFKTCVRACLSRPGTIEAVVEQMSGNGDNYGRKS